MKKKNRKIKIFTHNDLDGITCGWLIKKAKEGDHNIEIQYCGYHNINEIFKKFILSGSINHYKKVYITDISISDDLCQMIETKNLTNKITLIDHHETAKNLNKYKWCYVRDRIDTKIRSASYLVAKYFKLLDDSFTSDFVFHVDNYDTWRWEVEQDYMAKDINDLFFCLGRDRFLDLLNNQYYTKEIFTIENKHRFILDLRREEYESVLYKAKKNMRVLNYQDYNVGVVFNDRFTSELGNDLAKEYDNLDFVALINFKTGISLRCVKDNLHLGDIAKGLGESLGLSAGGHDKASGCTFTDDFRQIIINKLFGVDG